MRYFRRIVIALSVVALAAACGPPDNDSEDTGTTTDTGTSEDTAPVDTGVDTGTDTGTERDTATTDTAPETCLEAEGEDAIPLNYFKYYEQDQGGHSTQSGVQVSLSGQQLRITKIDPGNPSCELDCADAKTLRNDLLDQDVRQKMKDESWECGSSESIEGVQHKFEAQLGTTFDDPGQKLVNISGCIPDGSEATDAEMVKNIADRLMQMRKTYFDEQECHKSN